MNYIKLLSASVLILFSISSCDNGERYCSKLESRLNDVKVQKKLLAWVSETFANGEISEDQVAINTSLLQGRYTYTGDFDWSLLGFNRFYGEAKLYIPIKYGGDLIPQVENNRIQNIEAIRFIEQTRRYVMVKVDPSTPYEGEFKDYSHSKTEIAPGITLICVTLATNPD